MKTQIFKNSISAAIALAIAGCGVSDGGVSGIGGSGYISSGSISNFGSVFVNGVEFETDTSTFDVDGSSGTQDDLGIGMIVQVSGSINADGVTGTATNIKFDDQLQGPVSGLAAFVPGDVIRTFTVLGVTVIIDSTTTTFDISHEDGIPPATIFDFETIDNGNNVEISAFPNSAGKLVATRIELKDITFDLTSIVEVRGTITGLVNTSFTLNGLPGLTINAATASLDDLPNGLVEGQLVEVKGTFDMVNTITATEVEGEDNSIADVDEFEIEGLITDYVSNSNFFVNGIKVDASGASLEPSTLTLANDVQVEVEGAIVNGVLIATEIESRGGEAEVAAKVGIVNPTAGTFEVIPVVGQTITVTVTSSTKLEDKDSDIKSFTLATDDFVEIRGYEDGTGGITATEVKVEDPDDVIVQGTMSDFMADNYITVLGVSFNVDYTGGKTKFEANDVNITQDDFVDAAPTLVKVKDTDNDGVADEIEIESP